jgi:aminocarboxymuconate-semialdehyde decarboxylase
MSSRREFLESAGGAVAGVIFTGCSLLNAAQQSAAPRRLVSVGGQRVKTIDLHAHCAVPAAAKLLNRDLSGQDTPLEERLKAMDAQGIDIEALSINPFWYEAERDVHPEEGQAI